MFSLDDLAEIIDRRADASAEKSYTRSLLDKGAAHCARKFGEEAIELTIAAAAEDEAAVRAEAADVLYHLLVLLRARGVAFRFRDPRTREPDAAKRPRGKGGPQGPERRAETRKAIAMDQLVNRRSVESPVPPVHAR